ncbi:MAG: DUF1761 domain-containing protein [Candidatus Pacebacteria bacterium]|nr:DUF1761 domain-containing protein [Candidatus Paceibacterota bacterium]
MSDFFSAVSVWTILGAALAGSIFGSMWYSKMFFGKTWMDVTGKTKESMEANKKEMPRIVVYNFLVNMGMATALTSFIIMYGVSTLMEALQISILLALAFSVTTHFSLMLCSNEPHWSPRPQKLFIINAGYAIGLCALMSAVIFYYMH